MTLCGIDPKHYEVKISLISNEMFYRARFHGYHLGLTIIGLSRLMGSLLMTFSRTSSLGYQKLLLIPESHLLVAQLTR